MPYESYVDALEAAAPGSTRDARPDPTVVEALAEWELLTERELITLCGQDAQDRLPTSAVGYFWGAGIVVLDGDAAARRGLPPTTVAAARSLADLAEAFDHATRLVDTLADADQTDDRWSAPTPCDAWDLRGLLNHMVGSARMVTDGVTGRAIGPAFYSDHLGPDPVASYRDAAAEAVEAYRSDPTVLHRTLTMPWADLSGAELAVMFAADHLVHAWDVARTLDLELDVDPGLVERIRAFGDDYVAAHREPGMFGPEQAVPADASAIDRLAAYVGRMVARPAAASRPDT
jgi:uncharacterized protein (TIGR03086 family)